MPVDDQPRDNGKNLLAFVGDARRWLASCMTNTIANVETALKWRGGGRLADVLAVIYDILAPLKSQLI